MENCILHGDCRDILKSIPPASLIITSPPYNAGKVYEEKTSVESYQDFAESWVRLIPSALTETGSFWLNVGYTKMSRNSTLPLAYLYYPLINIPLVQEIVWHYEGGMSYKRRFTHRTERWMWFAKNPDNLTFNLDAVRDTALNRTKDKRNNPLGKNPTDYWYFDRVVSGTGRSKEKTDHPCQFPEKMIERIILACSNPGELVVDPFCGSGTTCYVAKRLGRRYIGMDSDAHYVEVARTRLEL